MRYILLMLFDALLAFCGFSMDRNSDDYKVEIIDSQQYLVNDYYHITDSNYYFIMRSVSVEVECVADNICLDMSRLYNGTMHHGDFRIDGFLLYAERENSYSNYVDNLGCVPSARLPYPFNKMLRRGERFRINLCYPDVVDIDVILKMIRCHNTFKYLPNEQVAINEMIKKNSITLQALSFLKKYAGYIYDLYAKEFEKLTFWENNLIPRVLSDEFDGEKLYLLDYNALRAGWEAYYYGNNPNFLMEWFNARQTDNQ